MTAECRECGWEGDEDVLEIFRCPKCGSRQLQTDSGEHTDDELQPPPDARKGE